ncbi:MAG: DUF1292 domain-containing protein [Clostridia bacterium]|nr:DUF1292 domain-containing protein [Clostridia bacterium]
MSDKYQENVQGEELTDVVELTGEQGDVLKFYHIGTIEYSGDWFVFFQPAEPIEGTDPDELVIFKIGTEGDKEVLLPVEDEALLDEVYAEFMRELEDDDEVYGEDTACSGDCSACSGCAFEEEEDEE